MLSVQTVSAMTFGMISGIEHLAPSKVVLYSDKSEATIGNKVVATRNSSSGTGGWGMLLKVVNAKAPYHQGAKGKVTELDYVNNKVQVEWEHSGKKTWTRAKNVKLQVAPQITVPGITRRQPPSSSTSRGTLVTVNTGARAK